MSEVRLNLTALRRRLLYEPEPELVRVEDLLESVPDGVQFSRRQVLRSAGLAAAVLTPAIRSARGSLTPTLRGPFKMEYDNDVVKFLLGKSVRWTIDPKKFSGPAKLTVDRTEDLLLIKLRDAFYPGTEIPADCTLSIRPRLTECTMKFAMAFGDFRGETSFEKWLAGDAQLKSDVKLAHEITFGNKTAAVAFNGAARAQFTPDWKLVVRGSETANAVGFGESVSADEASIALASTAHSSSAVELEDIANTRRTIISLERGMRPWVLDHGLDPEAHWTLGMDPNIFDRITLEAIEQSDRTQLHSIVAEQKNGAPSASFKAHSAKSIDGSVFALPLTRARLAILFDQDRVERAFEARYHSEPVWLHANGCSLLVGAPTTKTQTGDAQEIPTFELYAKNGVLEHMHCEPALLKIAAPLAGAIVEPAEVREGTRLAFVGTHKELEDAPADPYLATYALTGTDDNPNPLRFPANFVIGVVRPDDLLVLKFEFLNMEFKSDSKDGLKLVKQTGKDIYASYLVVHFPPQNIYEEAFFTTGDPGFTPASPTIKVDPPGSEPLGFPPVHARAARPSRLAFYLPAAVTSLPYSLEGLLDWSKLEPSLVPVALPPPPPPLTLFYLALGTYKQAALASGNVGANYVANGAKSSRAKMNFLPAGGGTPNILPSTLTDVRTSPKFLPTTNAAHKQKVIAEITKNTKVALSQEKMTQIAETISQTFPSQEIELPIWVFLDMTIREPHLYETALETPYRLIMSPNQYSGWAHSTKPVSATDSKKVVWTELWHTRLGIKRVDKDNNVTIDEQDDYYRTLRAVWSPDYNSGDSNTSIFPNHYDSKLKNPGNSSTYFRASLDARDRHELVELMSDHADFDDTVTRFVRAERLMLSSLGSWMNVRGSWKVPFNASKPLSVEEWRHRGTMGRDHYVKVVYKGFLFPFGHAASLIKVTERKFVWSDRFKCNICYLRQRMFIVVRQPVKQYPAVYQRNGGRKLPFTSVEITTLVTPDIAPPETDPLYKGFTPGQDAFWPHVPTGSDLPVFKFHLIGIDWEGRRVEFTMPLGFVDNKRAYDFTQVAPPPAAKPAPSFLIDKAIQAFLADTTKSKVAFSGHKIAFADSKKSGDTTFETTSITFGAEVAEFNTQNAQLGKADQPGFYPTVEAAELHIEAVKQIVGAAGASPMRYHRSFLEQAWDTSHNAGQVFLEIVGAPIGLAFGGKSPGASTTDKIGGLVSPSMAITGLSRLSGPLSGNIAIPDNLPLPDPSTLPAALKGAFDPKDFFGALDPDSIKLLGGLSLMDLLKLVTGASGKASDVKDAMESQLKDYANDATKKLSAELLDTLLPACPIPSYITQMIYDVQNAADAAKQGAQDVSNALKFPKQIQIVFKWNPEMQSFGPFELSTDSEKPTKFSLSALLLIPINPPVIPPLDPSKGMPDPSKFEAPSPGAPTYTVFAKLDNFTMDLFGVIAIKFNSVSFKVESGKKADVNADVDDVSFEGPLAFVNDLEKVIPSDGFTDPPSLEITPTGVKIGYDLSLPSISVGAFSLEHVSLGAELSLPFTGDPLRFRFHFCTRENPFLLTIYCFGGGGFFGIELGLDGLELLEASFEFGAAVALDFGIASGSVSIMAGIYFKLQKKGSGDECQITGYVRVNGDLDVCGIISVSIELYMAITYDSGPPKKCWGEATLTIKVSVLFFSIGFSTSMRKEFVDPSLKFADLMGADQWADYHMAFIDQFQVQK